jgi:hypothetical protein
VTVLTIEQQRGFGFDGPDDYLELDYDAESPIWRAHNALVPSMLDGRLGLGDVVCITLGRCQQPIVDAVSSIVPVVELGIGYSGTAEGTWRVFESHAWRHYVMGYQHAERGTELDCVIPNFYDEAGLPCQLSSSGRALFVGRDIEAKGLAMARAACDQADVELDVITGGLNHLAVLRAMSQAQCLIVPTRYCGPFEGVHVEAMLVGCPVVTSDFGVFTETVEDDVDGFRCATVDQMATAIIECVELDRINIATRARERFTYHAVAPRYEAFLSRVIAADLQ